MSFRKIDQFVGRHMTAKRWISIWLGVACGGSAVTATGRWWGIALWVLGVFMVVGNLRKLR